jgi:hypothetical protein
VIFFASLHSGYPHAFRLSLVELAIVLVGVAALTRLLPTRHVGEGPAAGSSSVAGPTRSRSGRGS